MWKVQESLLLQFKMSGMYVKQQVDVCERKGKVPLHTGAGTSASITRMVQGSQRMGVDRSCVTVHRGVPFIPTI